MPDPSGALIGVLMPSEALMALSHKSRGLYDSLSAILPPGWRIVLNDVPSAAKFIVFSDQIAIFIIRYYNCIHVKTSPTDPLTPDVHLELDTTPQQLLEKLHDLSALCTMGAMIV